MRILDIKQRTVPISRYSDPAIPPGDLTTSIVALTTDVLRDGEPVVGYGFASIGRFGQEGLIRERFAPRLLKARDQDLAGEDGTPLDPFKAWACLMAGEKPGGHGERSVAVGTLDMAIWDAAAKIAEQPLYRFLADRAGRPVTPSPIPVYAGGGYYYPSDDRQRLKDEVRAFRDQGFTQVKIKIGGRSLAQDLARIDAVLEELPGSKYLAVDALNSYDREAVIEIADALAPYRLRWFEDICDPLDYDTHAEVARRYAPPISAGEALFSCADANNLLRFGGLRPNHDVLLFDPVHCYGLPEYLKIIELFETNGWSRGDFQPHGGHLFGLQVTAALGLGGCEANTLSFQPFGGFADGARMENGTTRPPEAPGVGFETRATLIDLFHSLIRA